MSTPGSTEEPAGEVRRRRVRDEAGASPSTPDGPPLSRREMKARGIVLTTEIPVIQEPPGWGGRASAAATAHRTSVDRVEAGRAVSALGAALALETEAETGAETAAETGAETGAETAAETGAETGAETAAETAAGSEGAVGGPVVSAALPSRRTLRERQNLSSANRPDKAEAQTSTGRRPVVRAPLTARGLRTLDESGAITGVHSAIGHAVGRAVDSATSPASWESAVSMPAVALGIRDFAGPPTDGEASTVLQRAEDVAPVVAEDVAPVVAEDVAPVVAEDVATGVTPPLGDAGFADASSLGATEGMRSIATDAQGELEEQQAAARRAIHEEARRQAGLHRAAPKHPVRRAIGWIVAIVAIVVLLYVLSTGSLGSLLGQAQPGLDSEAGTLSVAVGALWMSRATNKAALDPSPEESRDR